MYYYCCCCCRVQNSRFHDGGGQLSIVQLILLTALCRGSVEDSYVSYVGATENCNRDVGLQRSGKRWKLHDDMMTKNVSDFKRDQNLRWSFGSLPNTLQQVRSVRHVKQDEKAG